MRSELFHPTNVNNIENDFLMEELGLVVAGNILQELEDNRKSICNHSPRIGGLLSWELATNEEKRAYLWLSANNNESESSVGGLKEEITKISMIILTHAGAMSMTRKNNYLTVDRFCASNKSKVMWI